MLSRVLRLVVVSGVMLGVLRGPATAQAQEGIDKIDHVIILFLENHTVDNLYSRLPGVNGVRSSVCLDEIKCTSALPLPA